jgi:hypothetical protein
VTDVEFGALVRSSAAFTLLASVFVAIVDVFSESTPVRRAFFN